jgi:hypothetical protein
MPKKRRPVAERQQESGTTWLAPSLVVSYNWPDTGPVPGRESALTWAGEPLEMSGMRLLEPRGKLGTGDGERT